MSRELMFCQRYYNKVLNWLGRHVVFKLCISTQHASLSMTRSSTTNLIDHLINITAVHTVT